MSTKYLEKNKTDEIKTVSIRKMTSFSQFEISLGLELRWVRIRAGISGNTFPVKRIFEQV